MYGRESWVWTSQRNTARIDRILGADRRKRPAPLLFTSLHGSWKEPEPFLEETYMAFFNSAVTTLQTLVVALGAGLAIWGVINLMEGYGNDNRATRS